MKIESLPGLAMQDTGRFHGPEPGLGHAQTLWPPFKGELWRAAFGSPPEIWAGRDLPGGFLESSRGFAGSVESSQECTVMSLMFSMKLKERVSESCKIGPRFRF